MDKTKEKTVVRELDEMRTRNRNAFEMSDGTKQMVFYPKAVNAFDEETKGYKGVDNTLAVEEDGKHYTNHKGRFTARFSNEDTNDELFTIEDGIYSVSVAAMRNHRAASKRGMPKHTKLNTTKDPKDTLVFDNIDDGVDYEYSVDGNGVKENIIVKKKADSYRYSFELTCKNVSAVYDEKHKRVIFCEPENNAEVFNIPAPFMTDANDALSTAVEYEIKPMKNGKIEFTVAADESWINADNRVFPVTIDPQISLVEDYDFQSFTYEDGTILDEQIHIVGIDEFEGDIVTSRMYIALNDIDIPENTHIKQAILTVYQFNDGIVDTSSKLGIFDVSGEELADDAVVDSWIGDMIDYEPVKLDDDYPNEKVSYNFDITRFIELARSDEFNMTSLGLKLVDEDYDESNLVILYGSGHSTYYPTITVTYEKNYAVNSAKPVHTHEIGRLGTGMIDLKHGNLMFECEDFAWGGNKMPVTIKHLYNSSVGGYQYTYRSSIELYTANFSAMNVGLGWRLNLMQSMRPRTFTYDDGVTYSGYIFIDETGEETYFKPEGSGSDTYISLNGNEMTYDSTSYELVDGDRTYKFDSMYRLIEIKDKTIEDSEGVDHYNTMSINYADNMIDTVVDGAGRIFRFAYDSNGDLLSITAPDGSQIAYVYDEDGFLDEIHYPNGTIVDFTTASNKIARISVYNSDDICIYRAYYGYNGNKIDAVEERGTKIIDNDSEYEYGVLTEYSYSAAVNRTTVYTTEIADADSGETEDNIIKTVYSFDSEGNIVSRYAYTDATGNLGIDGEVGGIHPHNADGGIDLASNVVNLLPITDLSDWDDIDAPAVDYDFTKKSGENRAMFGWDYLKMESNYVNEVEVGKCLNVSELPAGEYTFSAYLDLPNAGIEGTGNCGAFLRVTNADGYIISESERLNKNGIGYERLAAPFTLTEAQDVVVAIVIDGEGSINADAPQLENNPYANAYNMITNGSFENGLEDWTEFGSGDAYNTTGDFALGRAARIYGNITSNCRLRQIIYPKTSKSTRETFTLSGWAKGYGIVQRDRLDCREATFRLRAVLRYDGDFDDEEYIAEFSPCTNDWQFASVQFAKTQYAPVDSICVYLDFGYNNPEGYATFDNISLVRNSIEKGLTASDFPGTYSEPADTEEDDEVADTDTRDNAYDDFEEKYDIYGNPLTETTFTHGEFGTIYRSFEYTPEGEGNYAGNDLTVEYDARNNDTSYVVDPVTSRVTKVTDREGNITAYEYDSDGRTTKVTNKDSNETVLATVDYTYDDFDNLTAIERGDGMDYALTYNHFHKLETIGVVGRTNPLATYTYKEGNGRLKKITYANGDYMTATYNSIGQLVTEKWYNASNSLVAHYKYAYDHNGNIVRSIDILANKEYNYIYEEGRIVRASQCTITMDGDNVVSKSLDYAINYQYDADGKITRRFTSEDSVILGGTYYEYDKNDGTVVLYNDNGKTIASHSKTDSFGRKEFEELQLSTGSISRKFNYTVGKHHEAHINNQNTKFTPTTNLVSEIVMSDGHILYYEYDKEERITKVTDTDTTVTPHTATVTEYTYDALGQLLTETRDGVLVNEMEYDNYGNITEKNGKTYVYDTTWKDLLTEYNGQSITYDAQGNPTTYLGHTLTWEKGRQLHSFDSNEYTYNASGIRTSKTVGGVVHNYLLDGAKILRETWNVDNTAHTLETLWDNEDAICGIKYNGASYYFLKNLQGDIIAITDNNGAVIARYSYDAWGVPTIVSDTTGVNIATLNPFRYRGYYYDTEIGMYYLQSRYYDSAVGRFINADKTIGANNEIFTYDLYVYCGNNPTSNRDYNGRSWKSIWNDFKSWVRDGLNTGNKILRWLGIDTAGIGAFFLQMKESEKDIYHAEFNCWQQYFGYNDFYDFMFDLGTSMANKKFPFTYSNTDYVLWAWKGNYINLGAGAELGIYYGGPKHWFVDKNLAMNMTMKLNYRGDTIINYSNKTWWITGFNSKRKYLSVKANELTAMFTVKFNNCCMYKAFAKEHGTIANESSGTVICNDKTLMAHITI